MEGWSHCDYGECKISRNTTRGMAITPKSLCFRVLGDVNHPKGEINSCPIIDWWISFHYRWHPLSRFGRCFFTSLGNSIKFYANSVCRLPVKVDIAKGHYWQLILQPLGWRNTDYCGLNDISSAPTKGNTYYMGRCSSPFIHGDIPLNTVVSLYRDASRPLLVRVLQILLILLLIYRFTSIFTHAYFRMVFGL